MRIALVLQVVVLMSLSSSVGVLAGPITGQPAAPAADQPIADGDGRDDERNRQAAAAGAALFDAIGLPLLRLAAPIYLHLAERPKLRAIGAARGGGYDAGDGGGGGGADAGGAAGGAGGGILEVFPAQDIGNMTPQVGLHLTAGLVIPGPFGAALPGIAQVPEPSVLWLLAPAVIIGLRRRLHLRPRRS